MLLAIDTSNDYASVALRDERGLRGEATWFAGRQHSEQVLPQLDLLLRHLGAGPRAVTVVAVATGPGSWSGLRAGMSLAKAIAIASRIPLIGVPTLDALAFSHRGRGRQALATIRLGRDRYAVAPYAEGPAGWTRLEPFRAVSGAEALPSTADTLVVGDLALETGASDPAKPWAGSGDHQRRAASIAELAWERHARQAYDDLVALEPIYLGHPVREGVAR